MEHRCKGVIRVVCEGWEKHLITRLGNLESQKYHYIVLGF